MAVQLGTLTVPTLAAAPAVGAEGSVYYNSTSNALFASDGAAWVQVGGSSGVSVSDTAPGSPTSGMLWFKSDVLALYAYYDSQWVEVGYGSGTITSTGTSFNIATTWFYE